MDGFGGAIVMTSIVFGISLVYLVRACIKG
jgi:hypothetical protein